MAYGQRHFLPPGAGYCGTQAVREIRQAPSPTLFLSRDSLPDDSANVVLTIPVVFHVLYEHGATAPSDAQIYRALDILNEDFRPSASLREEVMDTFRSRVADVGITFALARRTPDGHATTGIVRQATTRTSFGWQACKSVQTGGSDPWPRAQYLNVWLVAQLEGFLFGGYAEFPDAPAPLDGIVLMHNSVGDTGTGIPELRHLLTHEVGHYLHLFHTWSPTRAVGDSLNCDDDDGLADTPNTLGNTIGAELLTHSCGSLDNVQNHMDYALQGRMFTQDQKVRMRTTLRESLGGRNQLTTAENLAATGVYDPAGVAPAGVPARTLIYPNPTADYIHLKVPPGEAISHWVLHDATGRALQQHSGQTRQADLRAYPPGLYWLRIYTPVRTEVFRLIRQ